jgi:hypothetical protein
MIPQKRAKENRVKTNQGFDAKPVPTPKKPDDETEPNEEDGSDDEGNRGIQDSRFGRFEVPFRWPFCSFFNVINSKLFRQILETEQGGRGRHVSGM